MLRKALALAVVAGTALVSAASPAGAATAPETAVAKTVVTSDAQRSAGSSTAMATTIGWDITDYSCAGTHIAVQSAQAKNGPDVNNLTSIHQLQRYQFGRWVTVARKPFAKSFPANGVWYYAPSPTTLWSWNLSAFGAGNYRVNVVYQYKWGSTIVAKRVMNTQAATGTYCRFA